MLINFFMALREQKLPVSFTELFALLECLKQNIVFGNVEDFYFLARMCMVKDEKNFDKFDIAFAKYFENGDLVNIFGKLRFGEDILKIAQIQTFK